MKKSRSTTPSDTNTSRERASYCNRLVDLLNPSGGWDESIVRLGSERAKEIAEERNRFWKTVILERRSDDKRSAWRVFYGARERLRDELKLSGLPKSEIGIPKLKAISRSSKKADKAKAPMASIALDAWTALDAARRDIEECKWSAALDSAILLGCCVGRLQGKNEIGAARRGKGNVEKLLKKAYQVWNDTPGKKKKNPRFDKQAAMDCCAELRGTGSWSLGNMISILKAQERRRQNDAAYLRKFPLGEVE